MFKTRGRRGVNTKRITVQSNDPVQSNLYLTVKADLESVLDIEPRLRKVAGCKQLIRLRAALQTHLKGCLEQVA